MRYYLTVDGGTTNTRVSLVCDNKILDTVRIALGARASIDGAAPLKNALRAAIADLLSRYAVREAEITSILASGMITSEFGLCELPHLNAPAGIAELHRAMHRTSLLDVSPIPFVFLRGVKCAGGTLSTTDMMRGEETELIGLMKDRATPALYVLPGSHSKLIETDAEGRITRFSTMLTGEMIASLSSATILRDAVDLSLSTLDRDALLQGCSYAREHGINEALFKVRILKNILRATPCEVYSFFLGCVLSDEISAILASSVRRVVIGGRAQIKEATREILQSLSDREIITLTDVEAESAPALGMIKIYEWGE